MEEQQGRTSKNQDRTTIMKNQKLQGNYIKLTIRLQQPSSMMTSNCCRNPLTPSRSLVGHGPLGLRHLGQTIPGIKKLEQSDKL